MLRSLLAALVVVGWITTGTIASAGAPARSESSDALSAGERAALVSGRLVVRPKTERRGSLRLFGGTSFQVVNVTADRVYGALEDPNSLWRMLPSGRECRVARREGASSVLYVRHALGPVSASYHLRTRYQAPTQTVTFQLDSRFPSDVRAGWGYVKVRPVGTARSLITFGAMVDLGDSLVNDAVRPRVHQWVLRIPSTMKRYLERRSRSSQL